MYVSTDSLVESIVRDKIDDLVCEIYGQTRDDIVDSIKHYCTQLDRCLAKNIHLYDPRSLFVLEYGGIGDSFHTKLWLQHIKRIMPKPVVLITCDQIVELFHDDWSFSAVAHGIFNKYRNPTFDFVTYGLSEILNTIFCEYVGKSSHLDISRAISKCHFQNQQSGFTSLASPYYYATEVERDYSIKHHITHLGKFEWPRRYICMETGSISFSENDPNPFFYHDLALDIKLAGFDLILVGGKDTFKPVKCYDYRGSSFYDTLSIMKGCELFIGRNSSNQGLSVFTPEVPVIDINSSDNPVLRFDATGYRDDKNFFIRTSQHNTTDVMRIINANTFRK